jgi:hypothetical protein
MVVTVPVAVSPVGLLVVAMKVALAHRPARPVTRSRCPEAAS